jgi:hypothetical protein
MAGLARTRLVSANPESWASFGVGEDASSRIRLSDAAGKSLVSLIVGNSEPGERGSFARLEGGNEVLLLSRSLSNYLDGSLSYWSHMSSSGRSVRGSIMHQRPGFPGFPGRQPKEAGLHPDPQQRGRQEVAGRGAGGAARRRAG